VVLATAATTTQAAAVAALNNHSVVLQVAPLLERPVGMALYEYRNGQIGPLSIQSGVRGGRLAAPHVAVRQH